MRLVDLVCDAFAAHDGGSPDYDRRAIIISENVSGPGNLERQARTVRLTQSAELPEMHVS
jgi:hypothetical protein